MKTLDYQMMVDKVTLLIRKQNTMVLATSLNNRVTARTVYTASDDLKIYFITSKAYLKYKQLSSNPHVALCFDNVQIEGVATALNHPLLPENKERLEKCLEVSNNFVTFLKYKNTILIEVNIEFIELWQNGKREYLDLVKNESYSIG